MRKTFSSCESVLIDFHTNQVYTSLVGKKLQYSSDNGVYHHSNVGLAVHKELNELHDLEFQ